MFYIYVNFLSADYYLNLTEKLSAEVVKVEVHKSMDGIKTGGRTKGTPNKITNAVKERLENLIDGLVSSLDIKGLNPAKE